MFIHALGAAEQRGQHSEHDEPGELPSGDDAHGGRRGLHHGQQLLRHAPDVLHPAGVPRRLLRQTLLHPPHLRLHRDTGLSPAHSLRARPFPAPSLHRLYSFMRCHLYSL